MNSLNNWKIYQKRKKQKLGVDDFLNLVYSNFIMNKVNKFLMVGILLLAVAIPLTTWLAVSNQENRSKAASSETETAVVNNDETVVDGVCGEMNGKSVTEIPDNRYACAKGAVNWMDTTADDGAYNWDCIGKMDGVIAHCEVSLEK